MTVSSMLLVAQKLAAAGLSVVPIRTDASKAPAVSGWKAFQERLPTSAELRHGFAGLGGDTEVGIAVIGGRVSGGAEGIGLEILDFDEPGLYDEWVLLCEDQGLGPLVESLPLAATGGGGRHLYYRTPDVPGNTKLAERWSEEKGRRETLIETRGEGGYAIIAPSPAACHPSGNPYVQLRGELTALPRLTPAQHDELISLARALNEWYDPKNEGYDSGGGARAAPPTRSERSGGKGAAGSGLSPGDDYNARASWETLLVPFGMARKRVRGGTEYWGWADNGRAICATVNHAGSGLLYNWSTAASPFEAEQAYDLFGAYARLKHGGDFSAAAKALAADGYGERPSSRHGYGEPPRRGTGDYAPPPGDEDAPPRRGGDHDQHGGDRGRQPSADEDALADFVRHPLTGPGEYPFTDLGNAKRLIDRWGRNLRYVHLWERWLIWDGRRWETDGSGGIQRSARETIQHLHRQAAQVPDKDKAEALRGWALKCESYTRLSAIVTIAHDEPGMPIPVDALDQQPMRLCVQNGTLDLRTGRLLPHDRADFITKIAPVEYLPDAPCPLWEAFLTRIFDNDRDLIAFMQRALGFALTGDTRRRALVILYGSKGRNGKSTLIDTIHTMLGDYALNTAPETLMAKRGEATNTSDIARLRGARFVAARESEEGQRLSESVIKQMTGGDVMTARFLYQDFFDFKPEFKLFLATNHAPQTRATDDGFWDRIRLVPFTVRIPDDEVDPDLPEKLLGELPGILAWCVRGCLRWQQEGLGNAAAVRQATESYRTDNDALGLFLGTCCTLVPHARTPASQLYRAYEAWCLDTGNYCQKQTAFGRKLTEQGIPAEKGSGGVVYRIGIGLTVEAEENP